MGGYIERIDLDIFSYVRYVKDPDEGIKEVRDSTYFSLGWAKRWYGESVVELSVGERMEID